MVRVIQLSIFRVEAAVPNYLARTEGDGHPLHFLLGGRLDQDETYLLKGTARNGATGVLQRKAQERVHI